ncbi:MAG: transcriptional regulator [Alphaproteobacteria bacterium]|nr:MAG: transcriptional regulator [Alphaproteobacteria bacterium]
MREATAAKGFSALGNETRLQIFRLLVQAGNQGAAVGVIQRHLSIPLSTLAHHLGMLVQAGLVAQEKCGREVICRADFAQLSALTHFLNRNCCAGLDAFPLPEDAVSGGAAAKEEDPAAS